MTTEFQQFEVIGIGIAQFSGIEVLNVRSVVLSREECKTRGLQHSFGINKSWYTRSPEKMKESLGLTDEQYEYWLNQFSGD